jgi:Flp pilus assembly protein TadG
MKYRKAVERGSVTVEAVILVPIVMIFVLLAVAFGRFEIVRDNVAGAARAGAEAAAVVSSPSTADGAAREAAMPALSGAGNPCVDPIIRTKTDDFIPGGTVSVTVTCSIKLSDLDAPGLPGSATVTATQTAPIDPFRVVS